MTRSKTVGKGSDRAGNRRWQQDSKTYDAGMERQISAAARKLGDDIQHVVVAAKQGNQAKKRGSNGSGSGEFEADEWKDSLLRILGGSDAHVERQQQQKQQQQQNINNNQGKTTIMDIDMNMDGQKKSDIDILLDYSSCEKFVLRCLENELPPNLIHCMRLLRVLELQMAHSVVVIKKNDSEDDSTNEKSKEDDSTDKNSTALDIKSSSKEATAKVEKLLCRLCSDPSVGEQLRPHLFGLLALSGASYPPNAIHVAQTASNVIVAIARECLCYNLAYFLHDRQMIIHMTDDLKELCGMSNTSSGTLASYCLQGKAAEPHGLWWFALRAIVELVRESCKKNFYSLLKDFYTAGGYHVLCYAIANSSVKNMKKVLELAIMMVSCQTEEAVELGLEDVSLESSSTTEVAGDHLASNPGAFAIIENLLYGSVPLLINHREKNNGANLVIEIRENCALRELSKTSIELSMDILATKSENDKVDPLLNDLLSCEILLSTMRLYSDHPLNYTIIEEKYDVLSQFLLSYTTFTSTEVKQLVLRTLEYVCTGIAEADCSKPLYVASEMFFCMCKTLFRLSVDEDEQGKNHDVVKALTADTLSLCDSIEKLLEVEDSLVEILIECGIMGDLLDEFLALIMALPSRWEKIKSNNVSDSQADCETPFNEGVDEAYCAICRVLDLIVKSSVTVSAVASPRSDGSGSPIKSNVIERRRDDLNLLLTTGITELGFKASESALRVFESKLSYGDDTALQNDMECIIKMFKNLSESIVDYNNGKVASENGAINSNEEDSNGRKTLFDSNCMMIARNVLKMLKSVLIESKSAQDTFRAKGGYESLCRLLLSMKGSTIVVTAEEKQESFKTIISVVEIIFEVLDASMMPTEREGKNSPFFASTKSLDLLSEETVAFQSPALSNRSYMRENGIYEIFISALDGLTLLNSLEHARLVIKLCFGIFEPRLSLQDKKEEKVESSGEAEREEDLLFLRNPDAIRLILGIIVLFPLEEPFVSLTKECLSIILELCSPENAGTTLGQIADTGMVTTLTSNRIFASIFDDSKHPLYSYFTVLLRRIASFKMSYIDFVEMLRGIAGPVIQSNDGSNIRLPIICSAVVPNDDKTALNDSNQSADKEENLSLRLRTLVDIAERGDRIPRCLLGGDSLPFQTDVQTDDKNILYTLAEQGRTRFIEVRKVDATAEFITPTSSASISSNATEKLWPPASTSGFSYSLWLRLKEKDTNDGNIFVFDMSASPNIKGGSDPDFISIWYDYISMGFNVITSSWMQPICFPVTPLSPGVWHHILLTFQPPKLTNVLNRKTVLGLCVDGRPLEVDLKVDSVPLPPNAKVHVGVPNSYLARQGMVFGPLPVWDAGSILLVSTILGPRDAMSIYAAGPDFRGQFWGDRPQRLSLAATATTIFSMLAECGERCSVAAALKRRNIVEIEAVSHVMRDKFVDGERGNERLVLLSAVGLFCQLAPECIVCALHPSSFSMNMKEVDQHNTKRQHARRLVNVARVISNSSVSTDAIVYGRGSIISPNCFADNVQWIGGPNVLLPIVNAAKTPSTLALSLRVIRESAHRHTPNLEMLQSGGGYRILSFLLHQKRIMNKDILEHCFAFAVHGFIPRLSEPDQTTSSHQWVLVDPDAVKYLVMNHQVWNLQSSGPKFATHLLSLLNGLVHSSSIHVIFNARRLHLLGIVKWALHLMLEISELYTTGSVGEILSKKDLDQKQTSDIIAAVLSAHKNGWRNTDTLSITSTSVGGDPGMPLLLSCKILLRSILARMLTPEDLSDIAGAVIYTLSVDVMHEDLTSQLGCEPNSKSQSKMEEDCDLRIGAVTRIYLVRLLEELIVDGVDEIASTTSHVHALHGHNNENNLAELSSLTNTEKKRFMNRMRVQTPGDDIQKQKDQNAQLFLSAFATVLTPAWFACVLQGCQDEASASAVFRLLIIMLQSSPPFSKEFQDAGGFTPLVLSIPKYSTSPSVMLSMLSQLLHAPILHLPSFGALDAEQLCSIFDTESDAKELILHESNKGGLRKSTDPSRGIFALLAECLGRNIQLGAVDSKMGLRARQTNEAVFHLLTHRHTFSSPFQEFCASPDFLEPLAQALCLVHSEKILTMEQSLHPNVVLNGSYHDLNRSASLSHMSQSSGEYLDSEDAFVDWPSRNVDGTDMDDIEKPKLRKGRLSSINMEYSPTVRFVGEGDDSTGIGLVRLLHHVISHAVKSGPRAAMLIDALFTSFPLHTTPEEVEAFHLVLIDQCRSIIEETLQRGSSGSLISFANCVGISSVLFDRLCKGFFPSEPTLAVTNIILSTLQDISNSESYAFRILTKDDPDNFIRSEAAHFARITSLIALQQSKPNGPLDLGDEILQQKLLVEMNYCLGDLLFTNSTGYTSKGPPSNEAGSKRVIWESCSLQRCSPLQASGKYPDLSLINKPDYAFIVSLMSELRSLLLTSNKSLREDAAILIVTLLKTRQGVISSLLTQNICVPGSSMRQVDIFHGGGFSSLQYHKAQGEEIDETIESLRLQTFFDWLDVNHADMNDVFDLIKKEAFELIPSIYNIQIPSLEDAIEKEQKRMLVNLSARESSNQTIVATRNRTQLAQLSHERTSESQVLWKRQGFDDLSSGAMQWKSLLRQLKGSCSLWEGSSRSNKYTSLPSQDLNALLGDLAVSKRKSEILNQSSLPKLITNWKLDITEGYERQRRKLLPNYEFDTLYNVYDNGIESERSINDNSGQEENDSNQNAKNDEDFGSLKSSHLDLNLENVEATAELLSKMKVAKTEIEYDDDDFDDDEDGETEVNELQTESDSTAINTSSREDLDTKENLENEVGVDEINENLGMNDYDENISSNEESFDGNEDRIDTHQNNYDLITGLLDAGDIPEKSYNVKRCTGLEVCSALFIRCRQAIYVIDGFEQTGEDGLKGNINNVAKSTLTYNVNLRPKEFSSTDEQKNEQSRKKNERGTEKKKREDKSISSSESLFQHRCKRIAMKDLYVFYRRRYQLQQVALEMYDVYNNGTFIAFANHSQSEEVLNGLLNSALPNSILNSVQGTSTNFDKFMKGLRSRITTLWTQGKMSNFDFLMHMNSFAGRSYNDLTQYPVFPWVLADYESEEIDLTNPDVYRDLSKPMGAIAAARAEQFKERYESLESHFLKKDDPPPFHYGTHYSCAAYVVNYLVRMEPFSRLALALQGGKFDLPDRLFSSIAASWKSASHDNLQDVRELIPEFFYLPEFLENNNSFDFGTKQDGSTVHNVKLPPWAKGDPRRFIRINRQVSTTTVSIS